MHTFWRRNKTIGIKTFVAFAVGSFALGSAVTFKHKFMVSFDVLWASGTELYIAPWTRISPYCVGVACGWYLHTYRNKFRISDVRTDTDLANAKFVTHRLFVFSLSSPQRLRNFMFFIATFLLVLALHSTVYRDMGVTMASTSIVFGRPLIASAVSWFIIMDACGYSCEFFAMR